MHGLHLPEWTLSLVVVVPGVGFPATFDLARLFDTGRGGVERVGYDAPRRRPSPGKAIYAPVGR
jgi:hypothetical protein